ncbi:unnamed protein product [Blepharisma stoltei]|uniref:Uncharacterized protein n=1 Tax=Blepharisma stoltei TaxID=1481888 RepID=A0AAU9J950_9CILI|nr:unnamed protein product [Blepharisma stoltei]
MSSSPSCLSFILCKRNKKNPSKSYTGSNLNISSFQEFISQKTNSSTQTPLSNDIGLKRGSSLTYIAAAVSINHKSSIVVKKADKFFPQHQASEKLETAESDWSMSSFRNKISTGEAPPDSFLSSRSFSSIFNSKKEGISWNKNCSQANSSNILANPFVSNSTQNRPRIIAITPATCLRKRLFPSMLRNNQRKNDNIIAGSQRPDETIAEHQQESKVTTKIFSNKIGLPIIDPIMDNFEGESSNSLVNL